MSEPRLAGLVSFLIFVVVETNPSTTVQRTSNMMNALGAPHREETAKNDVAVWAKTIHAEVLDIFVGVAVRMWHNRIAPDSQLNNKVALWR